MPQERVGPTAFDFLVLLADYLWSKSDFRKNFFANEALRAVFHVVFFMIKNRMSCKNEYAL